jgi:hypothetical protein
MYRTIINALEHELEPGSYVLVVQDGVTLDSLGAKTIELDLSCIPQPARHGIGWLVRQWVHENEGPPDDYIHDELGRGRGAE